MSGSYDSVFPDLQNELAGIVQDTALLMPAASLNGEILLKREIEDMFTDNSLFRLYGCGMTDLNYGWGIGPAGDAGRFEDDPTGRIGNLNVNNNVFNNYAIVFDGNKGIKETWPKDAFTLASFIDDGDVDSAELWGVLLLELDRSGFSYWIWYGKICDFQLSNNVWYTRRTGWRSWLRGLWQTVAGVQLPSSASDLPSQNFSQNAVIRLYAPFAVVRPKQRFIW